MKLKKKLTAIMLSAFCLAAAIPSVPAMADSQKVVTLGADLSDEQKTMILKYFGVYGDTDYQTLTITNEDEREHLGSYIPLEQIGTKTYSCALVSPTTSGGIQVKTANLTYVTSNMIASTLSTAGVVNCEVLAAAPFAVSGTGALTGVLMAYETASGETLDEEKKETATQELVTTTTISDSVGQVEATQIVNETKIQVIQGDVISTGDIEVIVDTVAEEEDISLSDEDRALLVELLEQIAQQDYDYEEMAETLERVEENLNELMEENSTSDEAESSDDAAEAAETENADTTSGTAEETEAALAEDSILLNTDDSALGSDVVFDATDESALTETEASAETEAVTEAETAAAETEAAQTEEDYGFDITVSDDYSDTLDSETAESADSSMDLTETESSDEILVTEGDDDSGAEAETAGMDEEAEQTETPADETETISVTELVFTPNTDEDAAEIATIDAGLNVLTISSARADLIAGSGTVSVYNAADGSLIEEIEMSDAEKVVSESITDLEELTELGGWTEGIEFRIYLSAPLAPDTSYYVLLSDDALMTADGTASLITSLDSNITWYFNTSSYGLGLDETVDGILAGDSFTGTVYVDSETSAYAVIDSITVDGAETLASEDVIEFTESSTFELTIGLSGEAVIHVSYYDSAESMNLVSEASYSVTIE